MCGKECGNVQVLKVLLGKVYRKADKFTAAHPSHDCSASHLNLSTWIVSADEKTDTSLISVQ